MHALQFIHTPTAARSPTDLLWELANKHRSLPDVPFLSSSPPLPACFSTLSNFFSLKQWSQWKIWVQARPSLQSHSLNTHTHICPQQLCMNTLPNAHSLLRLHLSLASFHGSTPMQPPPKKTFQSLLQDLSTRCTRWHCVSSCFRWKREWRTPFILPPPCLFAFMFRSGLDAEVNQMYWNSTHPYFLQKGQTFYRKKMQNVSKMCVSCFSLSDMKLLQCASTHFLIFYIYVSEGAEKKPLKAISALWL